MLMAAVPLSVRPSSAAASCRAYLHPCLRVIALLALCSYTRWHLSRIDIFDFFWPGPPSMPVQGTPTLERGVGTSPSSGKAGHSSLGSYPAPSDASDSPSMPRICAREIWREKVVLQPEMCARSQAKAF